MHRDLLQPSNSELFLFAVRVPVESVSHFVEYGSSLLVPLKVGLH